MNLREPFITDSQLAELIWPADEVFKPPLVSLP